MNKLPAFSGVDHLHVPVPDKHQAAIWYGEVLGFSIVDALRDWDTPSGPLTLEDESGRVHFALFAEPDYTPLNVWALGASGRDWLAWRSHLQALKLGLRCADHQHSYSLYFTDPFGHQHEITTVESELVREVLEAG